MSRRATAAPAVPLADLPADTRRLVLALLAMRAAAKAPTKQND